MCLVDKVFKHKGVHCALRGVEIVLICWQPRTPQKFGGQKSIHHNYACMNENVQFIPNGLSSFGLQLVICSISELCEDCGALNNFLDIYL